LIHMLNLKLLHGLLLQRYLPVACRVTCIKHQRCNTPRVFWGWSLCRWRENCRSQVSYQYLK
jgi:hypothetical protein